jgi:hypothetical protein
LDLILIEQKKKTLGGSNLQLVPSTNPICPVPHMDSIATLCIILKVTSDLP